MTMSNKLKAVLFLCFSVLLMSFVFKKKVVKIYLAGDSTVADYSLEKDFQTKRYPVTGWGQVFQQFVSGDNLKELQHIIKADSALVDDRAKGGRSTRTFFEEGRWAEIYKGLQKNDVVMIQFGHNDAAVDKTERYVTVQGYKEYLRLFVNQAREKGAIPILVTPVARNYPWKDGKLSNVHGDYPQAMKDVAKELNVSLIDLNQLSMDAFAARGQEYVSSHYFMNLPAGKYVAYPEGQKDNTHFQPEGATEVARLVYQAMKSLNATTSKTK
jgi:lysophospholipase L1-like esterase